MKRIVLAGAVAALALAAAQVAHAEQTYTDAAGDSGGAPDITAVKVSNDAAGTYTLAITIANQATLASDALVGVLVDSDANTATGDSDGMDTTFLAGSGGSASLRWNGTEYAPVSLPTFRMSNAANTVTFSIGKADLGGTSKLSFYVFTAQVDGNGDVLAADEVATGDTLAYELTKPVALRAGAPLGLPGRPIAGKAFTVTVPITRTDTGQGLAAGQASCVVSIGGAPVAALGKVAGGAAKCTLKVPKTARGKVLRGTVTVVYQTAQVTKSFSFKVV